ncbi:MAG: hypothetical protein P8L41_09545 [Paracoccaceae bacterium]|nr:hypothetical protein [Paracoccaceae bacterium]
MDITRILKMIMNMAMRQLMRRGVNKAFSMGSRSAKAEQGDQQTQSNPSSKVDAKRIRKSMKAVRRISRF